MTAAGGDAARRAEPREPGSAVSLRYRVMRALDAALIWVLFDVRIDGLANRPPAPYCLVPNHHSAWDPLILMAVWPAVPRITWFGPRERDFSRGFSNRVMAFYGGVIPFHPEKTTVLSATRAVRRVFDGRGVLGIFAEGQNGFAETRVQPFEEGAVAFASSAGVPILPCAVIGTTYVWLRKRLTVRIGPPIDTSGVRGETARNALSEQVRRSIEAMLPSDEPPHPGRKPLRGLLTDIFHSPEETARRVAALGD